MFFDTFEFYGFFLKIIYQVLESNIHKKSKQFRWAKSQVYRKEKKEKKNIAVCLGVLSRSFLFFESKKSKNWYTIPNNVVN